MCKFAVCSLVQYVSTLEFLCFDVDTFGKPQLYCVPVGYNNQWKLLLRLSHCRKLLQKLSLFQNLENNFCQHNMLVFNQFQLSKSINVNIEEHYSKHSRYPRGGVGAARLRPRVRGEVRAAAGCGTWLLTAPGTRRAPTLDMYYLRRVDCSVLGPPLSISRRRIHQNPALCSKGYYHRCQYIYNRKYFISIYLFEFADSIIYIHNMPRPRRNKTMIVKFNFTKAKPKQQPDPKSQPKKVVKPKKTRAKKSQPNPRRGEVRDGSGLMGWVRQDNYKRRQRRQEQQRKSNRLR